MIRTSVRIGERVIGGSAPRFVTYEAGPTHAGLGSAQALVRPAAAAGAHAGKFKIASADLNHRPLLRKAARTGLNIQLDTGNGTLGEVESAIDIVRREGNENIVIHHCPSGYPARLESINLRVITTLQQMFPYPVAYSDHTPGWDMDIAAVTLGAPLGGKTITLDRGARAVQHTTLLGPRELKNFLQP